MEELDIESMPQVTESEVENVDRPEVEDYCLSMPPVQS